MYRILYFKKYFTTQNKHFKTLFSPPNNFKLNDNSYNYA